jgi:hypothetical protein
VTAAYLRFMILAQVKCSYRKDRQTFVRLTITKYYNLHFDPSFSWEFHCFDSFQLSAQLGATRSSGSRTLGSHATSTLCFRRSPPAVVLRIGWRDEMIWIDWQLRSTRPPMEPSCHARERASHPSSSTRGLCSQLWPSSTKLFQVSSTLSWVTPFM